MLEDYIGLNLESLVDPSTLQQRITTLIKRMWTKLIPRYKSEYLGNATEHPIANYERGFTPFLRTGWLRINLSVC